MTTRIPARVAAVLLGPGGLSRYLRDCAGQDPEVDVVLRQLVLDARNYALGRLPDSGQTRTSAPGYGDDRLVSTAEAAQTLGVDVTTIGRRIRSGQLPATQVGARYAIRIADLARFAQTRAA